MQDVAAYLTVNLRCTYSIEENLFFVNLSSETALKTVIDELWHFYTWYKFGKVWEEKIGKENIIK